MTVMDTPQQFDALVGNRPFLEGGIGYEAVTRGARLVLLNGLNDEIDTQEERWRSSDLHMQSLGADPELGQVDVDHVPAANFHEGPHKSLIEAPVSAFPNVSAFAYISVPSASQFDQFDTSDITLFIETAVIAGPVADGTELAFEKIVHRRIQRTTEAVAIVVARNPLLLNTASNLKTPPRGRLGNPTWARRKDKGAGDRYLWQGSRLQYTLQRHHL